MPGYGGKKHSVAKMKPVAGMKKPKKKKPTKKKT